jgi:hypothetical protein
MAVYTNPSPNTEDEKIASLKLKFTVKDPIRHQSLNSWTLTRGGG